MRRRDLAALEGVRAAAAPPSVAPMLATLCGTPFSKPDWTYEIKWDGMRALAFVRSGALELRSRTDRVVTRQFPDLAPLPKSVIAGEAVIDGEIVVLNEDGRSDFQRLQQRMNNERPSDALLTAHPVLFYAFDVVYCDGYDLRNVRLSDRKQALGAMLAPADPVRLSDHFPGQGIELYEAAKQMGLEGVIAKRLSSCYVGKRSPDWQKLKTTHEIDAVIGGYTAPRGSRGRFGALLLGVYDRAKLEFIGAAGTGFNTATLDAIWSRLAPLTTPKCPFRTKPQTPEPAQWVEPRLVARVKFGSWTADRRLRAPVFLGVRDDKSPAECTMAQ